ncbi:MAG: hypothetical protein U5K84_13210 [Alkalibacterium sp.]|nr:hypothetical protein [Alkalibacterium sp.]
MSIPGEAEGVLDHLEKNQLALEGILARTTITYIIPMALNGYYREIFADARLWTSGNQSSG